MNIIKKTREKLGYTQASLAKETGLSLRTIQRLEASKTPPKGHTLKVLSEALELDISVLKDNFLGLEKLKTSDKLSIKIINLSILLFLGIPFGNLIFPFIFWNKKRKSKFVDETGRKIINFQILWTIIFCVSMCFAPFVHIEPIFSIRLIFFVLIVSYAINIGVVFYISTLINRNNFNFLNLPIRLI